MPSDAYPLCAWHSCILLWCGVLQDHDGSHIKGLLINFLHAFWPSLLKQPNFLLEFITPIVKVSKGGGGEGRRSKNGVSGMNSADYI